MCLRRIEVLDILMQTIEKRDSEFARWTKLSLGIRTLEARSHALLIRKSFEFHHHDVRVEEQMDLFCRDRMPTIDSLGASEPPPTGSR